MSAMEPLGPRPNPLPLRERLTSYLFRAPVFAVATAFFASIAVRYRCLRRAGAGSIGLRRRGRESAWLSAVRG